MAARLCDAALTWLLLAAFVFHAVPAAENPPDDDNGDRPAVAPSTPGDGDDPMAAVEKALDDYVPAPAAPNEPSTVDPAPPTEDMKAETLEEYHARRAKIDNGPAPFLFAVTDPATGRVAHLQGAPTYHTRSLYPFHPRLRAVLDAADYVIAAGLPKEETESGAAEDEDGISFYSMMRDSPEKFVKLLRDGMPAAAKLPEGRFLSEMLDPVTLAAWRAFKKNVTPSADDEPELHTFVVSILDFAETLDPLGIVALTELILDLRGSSRDTEVISLEARLAAEALQRELATDERRREFIQIRHQERLAEVFASRFESLDEKARMAELVRLLACLAAFTESYDPEDSHPFIQLIRREYDAWFANDPGYLPPEQDWTGLLQRRQTSEWRLRVMATDYANQLADARSRHEHVLMVVPMEFLAEIPGNLRERLAGKGLLVAADGAGEAR